MKSEIALKYAVKGFLVLVTFCWACLLPGMARKLRVEYPGAIYHVMNRGDRGEEIFKADQDRQRLVATLEEACVKTGWQEFDLPIQK